MRFSFGAIAPLSLGFALTTQILISTSAFAQHEQTPINIDSSATVIDTKPPVLTFNNYSFADLKVQNTYGAQESFYTVKGTPATPGDLKNVTINAEWATLKATPCADPTLKSCASYATKLPNAPSITIDGKEYILQQFHFHVPAEHMVDGRRPAMEVHFVHLLNNGCAADDHRPGAVVGAFIEEGPADPELGKFFDLYGAALGAAPTAASQYVRSNLAALLPKGKYTWRYEGGLTAPTGSGLCGVTIPESIPGGGTVAQQLISGVFPEVVHWYLYKNPLYMTAQQIKFFKTMFPEGNSRVVKENENHVYETPAPPPAIATKAVANPKNATALGSIALDGTASISFDGKPLTYAWTVAPGGKNATITSANTATPLLQFPEGYGNYIVQLTVTDSAGNKATDTTVILYVGR